MNRYIEYLLSLPKSVFFCVKTLPFVQAIRLPILVRYNVIVRNTGHMRIGGGKSGCVRIGFGNVGIFDKHYQRTVWDVSGQVLIKGNVIIGHGSRIVVGKNGVLTLGDNFACTANMSLVCFKRITIGDDVLISWDTLIMDTDFHQMVRDGETKPKEKDVVFGNHVWIGCRTTILKGSSLPNNSVVAAGTIVRGKFIDDNVLIGGNPAKIINGNVDWTK